MNGWLLEASPFNLHSDIWRALAKTTLLDSVDTFPPELQETARLLGESVIASSVAESA